MRSYRFGEPEQAATTICVLRCDGVHFYFYVVQRYGNSGNKQALSFAGVKFIAKTLPNFLKWSVGFDKIVPHLQSAKNS